MSEEIIIDGIKYFKQRDINKGLDEEHYITEFHLLATHYNLLLEDYARKYNSLKEQLKRKEQECEELHERTASIIYSLTGGRLSYSTYTLEGCEDAYRDQLSIDVERATKELVEENETLKSENFTFEELVETQEELIDKYKQALDEIGKLIPKFDSSLGCDYGDFDCENCSDLDENTVCTYKLKKVIKGIIDKAKENINEG